MDNIQFKVDYELGEVGGPIPLKENDTKVNGNALKGSTLRYTYPTFIFVLIFIIYILF